MRVKTYAKRAAILRAAAAEFGAKGLAGAAMTAVAARVGGSKATLYRYFSSKEELFVAVMLGEVLDHAQAVFDELTPSADLRRMLERFGARFLTLTLSAEALAARRMSIAEGWRSGIGQKLFERGPRLVWTKMADFLAGEMDARRLRAADPWLAAMHLRGLLEADLVNRALIGADIDARPSRLRRHAASAIDAFLRAYAFAPSSARATPPSTARVAPTT
ncbi:MAG: TetR/AcrR family transcriptional regulator C-terminal domain-containing protein [Caulobacteraceae bacterium]